MILYLLAVAELETNSWAGRAEKKQKKKVFQNMPDH
jgi:hypothetical protein